jgi:uncharacterized membrane protein YdbT with pleckstrin-like domain
MNELHLHPKPIFWFCKNFIVIAFALLLAFANQLTSDMIISSLLLTCIGLLFFTLLYSYIEMMFFTKWDITDEKVKITKGIFYKKINYIELYRVTDYSETQNFIQQIFKNKTVNIISGDKTHPVFSFYGIDAKIDLVETLRKRVERQKMVRGIYEVTNR